MCVGVYVSALGRKHEKLCAFEAKLSPQSHFPHDKCSPETPLHLVLQKWLVIHKLFTFWGTGKASKETAGTSSLKVVNKLSMFSASLLSYVVGQGGTYAHVHTCVVRSKFRRLF